MAKAKLKNTEVLARKHRPEKLSDLIGQPSIVTTLQNAIEMNKLHHAYLFHGTRGTGKTSTARILAAMINCEKGLTITPCGTCFHCNAIFNGKHNDIEELDAASNGKIDEIRELKKSIYYAPIAGARKKVYIIDEFHRTSREGEDCLLKAIEEPPKHVVFVLCTTELHQMKATIVSRCQSHVFQKIHWAQIEDHLSHICKKEKIEIEEEALRVCATSGDGSVRDSLQCLDKLINYAGKDKITNDMTIKVLGITKENIYYKLISCIIGENGKPNITKGYEIINDVLSSGSDVNTFLNGLDDHLRALLIASTAPKAMDLLPYNEQDKKRIRIEAGRFDIPKINAISKLTNEIHKWIVYNVPIEKLLDQWLVDSILSCHLKKGD